MEAVMKPNLMTKKYFTPGVIVLSILALNGLIILLGRLIFGLGAITNLSNQYPWGIWIGIDVAAGVALAAGGFTTAAIGHIFHREDYHAIIRPALLTALLGYTFVALGVCVDLGRWYYIWHPLIMWNGNSVLFEVGICVMAYMTVLYIEFIPIVTERFIGQVKMIGLLEKFNDTIDWILRKLDKGLSKVMFAFIILGVVLSCLHQSSVGTLMVIAGEKMHPLWQTPILPLLFLLSAISVGFPMVIMESIFASRSFGLKPEMHILTKLARYVGPLLGIYLAFRIGDIVIREAFFYLAEFTTESVMFYIEIIIGVIIPLRMLFIDKVIKSPFWLLIVSLCVIFGVFLNRINSFIIAYTPPYSTTPYFPSFGEISVTVGFIAIEVLLYRLFVKNFPIISVPQKSTISSAKYSVKGA
ncbi:MAG: Ni/Fe-hydrogenase cytochrome b subunit [Calditrichia bacterium]|nr:Ni/Fe-hydrogenase cytochrome b subunit [Calditrichia bacterium]